MTANLYLGYFHTDFAKNQTSNFFVQSAWKLVARQTDMPTFDQMQNKGKLNEVVLLYSMVLWDRLHSQKTTSVTLKTSYIRTRHSKLTPEKTQGQQIALHGIRHGHAWRFTSRKSWENMRSIIKCKMRKILGSRSWENGKKLGLGHFCPILRKWIFILENQDLLLSKCPNFMRDKINSHRLRGRRGSGPKI